MTPQVSVVIATYNRRDYLQAALDSVKAQTFSDWECLVCDDGSTDDTSALVAEYAADDLRFKFLPGPRFGLPAGPRNRGIAHARAPWVAFLDDDDQWHPRKLEVQWNVASTTPATVISVRSAGFETLPDDWSPVVLGRSVQLRLTDVLLRRDPYPTTPGTMVLRAAVMTGGFAESAAYRAVEDFDLWCRLLERTDTRWVMIDGSPLAHYRILGSDSISTWRNPLNPDKIRQDWAALEVLTRTAITQSGSPEMRDLLAAVAAGAEDCARRSAAIGWRGAAMAGYAASSIACLQRRDLLRVAKAPYHAIRLMVRRAPKQTPPACLPALIRRTLVNTCSLAGLAKRATDPLGGAAIPSAPDPSLA